MEFIAAGEIIGDLHQVRSIVLSDSPGLPDGEYRFIDFYCTDKNCDCRKTIIHIHHNDRHVSTVSYGWENPQFYVKWMGRDDEVAREMSGLSIDFASPDQIDRRAVLPLMAHLLDEGWLARIKNHYRMVREEANPPENMVLFEPKISRNALCPCGSGKKYKKCCGRN